MGIFGERMRGGSITRGASPDPCCSTSVTEEASKCGCLFFFGCAGCQLWHLESLVAAFELLLWHVGSSSPTGAPTLAPFVGNIQSQGLGHQSQGSPSVRVFDAYILGLLGEGREIDNETSFSSFCPTSLVPFPSVWSFLGLSPKPTSTLETKSALFITQGVQAKKPTGENVRHGSGRGWNGDVTLGFREKWTSFWDIF